MSPYRETRKILIVDDDEGLRLLLADILRADGYSVASAASGKAAVDALRKETPVLMLLDLQLKDMAGTELLSYLRSEGRHIPFVVVTGQGDEKVAVEMMKQGALDYVMKDSAILDLLPSVIKRAIQTLERDQSLARAEAERVRLEREILAISETERQRFAADLHDGVGQHLTAIELMCVALKNDVSSLDAKLGKELAAITAMLQSAISETRSLARGLSPLDEQPEAFQNGLTHLASQARSTGRLKCRVECNSLKPVEDRAMANHLYRIAQEAINNATKHSQGKEVLVRWDEDKDSFRLEISDDGTGVRQGKQSGLGLGLMKYRAAMIGAHLTTNNHSGGGFQIVCVVPKAK